MIAADHPSHAATGCPEAGNGRRLPARPQPPVARGRRTPQSRRYGASDANWLPPACVHQRLAATHRQGLTREQCLVCCHCGSSSAHRWLACWCSLPARPSHERPHSGRSAAIPHGTHEAVRRRPPLDLPGSAEVRGHARRATRRAPAEAHDVSQRIDNGSGSAPSRTCRSA